MTARFLSVLTLSRALFFSFPRTSKRPHAEPYCERNKIANDSLNEKHSSDAKKFDSGKCSFAKILYVRDKVSIIEKNDSDCIEKIIRDTKILTGTRDFLVQQIARFYYNLRKRRKPK